MTKSRILIAVAAVGVFLAIATAAFADHSWNGYHWPDDNLQLTVVDKTSSNLFDIPAAVKEWADEGTPIQPGMASGNQGDVDVVVKRMNANWLGVARISVDENGHIQAGRVELNRLYLNSLSAVEWDQVVCQEIGHILGLDHNRNITGTDADNDPESCMNDQATLGSATSPNQHDTDQLNAIYDGHVDVADGGGDTGDGGSGACPPAKEAKGKCSGSSAQWITVHARPAP
jgi:hypothetical protein